MKQVICIYAGLMELEGRTEIKHWGWGEGKTLRDVCLDIIKQNPEKGKYFTSPRENKCFDWGMELRFLDK